MDSLNITHQSPIPHISQLQSVILYFIITSLYKSHHIIFVYWLPPFFCFFRIASSTSSSIFLFLFFYQSLSNDIPLCFSSAISHKYATSVTARAFMLLEYLHMCEHLINVPIFVQLWSSSVMLLPDSYCAHTSTEREVLVICDKGKSVNPLLLQQELEPSYHNCHLKPAPASPSPVSASVLSYFNLTVFSWPVVYLIHTNHISIDGDGNAISKAVLLSPQWGLLLSQRSPVSASD